MVPWKT